GGRRVLNQQGVLLHVGETAARKARRRVRTLRRDLVAGQDYARHGGRPQNHLPTLVESPESGTLESPLECTRRRPCLADDAACLSAFPAGFYGPTSFRLPLRKPPRLSCAKRDCPGNCSLLSSCRRGLL